MLQSCWSSFCSSNTPSLFLPQSFYLAIILYAQNSLFQISKPFFSLCRPCSKVISYKGFAWPSYLKQKLFSHHITCTTAFMKLICLDFICFLIYLSNLHGNRALDFLLHLCILRRVFGIKYGLSKYLMNTQVDGQVEGHDQQETRT